MKYTKYRITKEMGLYYIEVPFLFFFWQRLSYSKWIEIGFESFRTKCQYEFKRYNEAFDFAEHNKYLIVKE